MSEAVKQEEPSRDPHTPVDLNGRFNFKVDSKGRVALPAKFRKVLSKDLIVTPDPRDECLYVFEVPAFNNWVETLFKDKFGGYKSTDALQVKLRRKLKARASDVSVDTAGRIMLTPEARDTVDIDKDVVIVGNTGYFEIWDAKRYEQDDEDVDLKLFYS